jgi:type I restriction enzyme S subunit
MNAEQLLQHYERIADAPDAVERLRQAVLTLAVRGKLLAQVSNDEPITITLKKQPRLPEPPRFAKRSVEKIPGNGALSVNHPGSELPSGWHWVPLVSIARLESGHTPSRNRPDWWDGNVPWIGLVDARIHNDGIITETIQHTNAAGLANSAARLLPKGTVCFSRTASVGYVVTMGREMATSQDFVNWVPTPALSSDWLALALRAERPYLGRFSKGAVHQTIYFPAWLSMHIALPPLAEQRRIVAKVDELMALCDRLEAARAEREMTRNRLSAASLARLNTPDPDPVVFAGHARFTLDNLAAHTTRPDQIKQLRQTILNLAVRGKLVTQNPKDEPASRLLQRAATDIAGYAKRHGATAARAEPISPEQMPFDCPLGWNWSRLSNAFRVVTDGDHQPPPRADKGIAFLTIGNVTTGQLQFDGCRLVPFEYYRGLAGYRRPTCGDILYTVVGATYGRPALVDTDREFCVQRHIAILRPSPELNTKFLLLLLASPHVYEQATASATGTAQPTIGLRPLRNFLIPIPPLAEQHRIVAKADQLMALCDQLEASLTEGSTTRRRLLDAFLAKTLAPVDESQREAAQ